MSDPTTTPDPYTTWTTTEPALEQETAAAAAAAEPDIDTFDDGDEDTARDSDETTEGPARSRAGITKPAAKKIIEKYLEIAATPRKQIKLLASTIGVKADPVELAATIVSAPRANVGAINELFSIAEASTESPYAGVIAAFGLSKDDTKRVWALLTQLDKVGGAVPVKEATAAAKIAEAAGSLTDEDTANLEAVKALGRK